ncbi:hypothetical protein [Candidatus Dormiibacter inghamiae]|uniref:hypothetical protein n=1 Tax=Candidatus Dormiibacter inghamiae TaxID=3127013 RepID=UPI0030C722E7
MTALLACALAFALLGCGENHAAPDDSGFQQAVRQGHSGSEVTVDGTLLQDPFQSGTHEHLLVSAPGGTRLEVDHNTGLATWVPAHSGDSVVIHGQLYIDSPSQIGVHCTHAKTSSGCPTPGWIEYGGQYYE